MAKNIICKGCGKKASELSEYITMAKENNYKSAEDFVINEEGTYNPNTGLFYCTDCYIKAGMPLGTA